ncbi:MAG: thioesterase family protein [Chitinophagaceae bacterium]|nr:thioesterase family protein [Chitinophagaceae bacterium]
MARIQIDCPEQFSFHCTIPVRITDINYGSHAGNDAILGMVHEARMQYLQSLGYTELSFAGCGLIMSDAALQFKQELFYGEMVEVSVQATELGRIGFDLVYKMEKSVDGKIVTVAIAKTGMVCYNYQLKKPVSIPAEAAARLKP